MLYCSLNDVEKSAINWGKHFSLISTSCQINSNWNLPKFTFKKTIKVLGDNENEHLHTLGVGWTIFIYTNI